MLHHPTWHHSRIEEGESMSSIIKSISLDPQTAELAKRIPNFSRFVRECLIRHHFTKEGVNLQCMREDDESQLCNPYSTVKGRCLSCWPAGPPPHEAWRAYRRKPVLTDSGMIIEAKPDYMVHELVQEAAEDANPPIFGFEDMIIEGNAKPTKKDRQVSMAQRLWGGTLKFWKK